MKTLKSTLTLLALLAVSAHAGEALIRSDFESGALDEWLVIPYAQPMPAVEKGDSLLRRWFL
jgi:ABC-type transport system involved in cytochrome c biogenesis permease component